jgi:hypothetical protein
MAEKLINLSLLSQYHGLNKTYIDTADTKSIKAATYADNTLKFFKTEDASGEAAYSFNLPEEMFLDQAKTEFVNNFSWSELSYPGSQNPELDGKPVLVLAVKDEEGGLTFSFVSLEKLIDIYTGEATSTATVSVSADNKITTNVKISTTTGNVLTVDDNGLFVPTPPVTDISGKADKVTGATEGNFAGLDVDGNLTDSGSKAADFEVAGAAAQALTDAKAYTDEKDTAMDTRVKAVEAAVANFATTDEIAALWA